MSHFLVGLFEYHHHCNQSLIKLFEDRSNELSEKLLKLMSHVLNAQHIWIKRIQSKQPVCGVWEIHSYRDFRVLDLDNKLQTNNILEEGFYQVNISYANSKGEWFENQVEDILFHIINHSTYHRGQIATELKRIGIEPLPTDYIMYKR